jgi:SH3 domain protein
LNIKISGKPVLFLLVLGLILIAMPSSVYADTRYVSDKLIITMRTGAGNEYKIIKTLETGAPVEVLEETGKHYKVRTKDGKEGWVLRQYIVADIPKTIIISGLKEGIGKLKGAVEKLKRERDAVRQKLELEKGLLKGDVKKLEKTLKEKNGQISGVTGRLKEMTDKYNRLAEDSGDVVKVVSERDALKKENARLGAERDELSKENESLFKRNAVYWFLAGGGVFFIGWIVGQFSRKKKKFYSDSFLR